MELRRHPSMTYRGAPSWPPVWVSPNKAGKRPSGEVGVLVDVEQSKVEPDNRYFITIKHNGASYTGCLLIDDGRFGQKLSRLLQKHLHYPLEVIGGIDLRDRR
ncbi:MAG TPA: hypothetical protein VL754_14855 [Verrucomicrobiae bacterium]|jgi:hypothetical protein|nr:hypothetical protein [Verrucomicrobiae bacterium]